MGNLNALQKALVNAGLADAPKPKRRKQGKPIKCNKCGNTMTKLDYSNIAVCQHCEKKISFIVFD